MMPMPRSSIKWRMFSDERFGRDAADLHRVVRDQAVAALDELDGGLALADAALAEQQKALAVDLDEHAVARDARRELDVEERDQRGQEARGAVGGAQQRDAVPLRRVEHLRRRLEAAREDHGRGLFLKKFFELALLLLHGVRAQIAVLVHPEDLDAGPVEIFEKPVEMQAGAVDVGARDINFRRLPRHIQRLERKFVDDLFKRHGKTAVHFGYSSLSSARGAFAGLFGVNLL